METIITFIQPISVIILIAIIIVIFDFASKTRDAVKCKGYNADEMHIFAWCFFFPALAIPYAASLPDVSLQNNCMAIEKQNQELLAEIDKLNKRLDAMGAFTSNASIQDEELPDL